MTGTNAEDKKSKTRLTGYQKYQVIAAWASEVTMALEHLGITPKETRGLLITTITAGII